MHLASTPDAFELDELYREKSDACSIRNSALYSSVYDANERVSADTTCARVVFAFRFFPNNVICIRRAGRVYIRVSDAEVDERTLRCVYFSYTRLGHCNVSPSSFVGT